MSEAQRIRTVGAVLYDGFELLDLYGPLQMWAGLREQLRIVCVAEQAGPVPCFWGPRGHADVALADAPPLDVLLVPGGFGTRAQIDNPVLIDWLRERAAAAEYVTSVCTGSALLARAGVLDGRRATSNKRAFEWVRSTGPGVEWVPEARWVEDGNVLTSSGVAAGMDMALALVARLLGEPAARAVAQGVEYEWHDDPSWDPFARLHGLV